MSFHPADTCHLARQRPARSHIEHTVDGRRIGWMRFGFVGGQPGPHGTAGQW